MKRPLAEILLDGYRIRYKRLMLRVMPLRWYIGPGLAPRYLVFNFGPLQLFVDIEKRDGY